MRRSRLASVLAVATLLGTACSRQHATDGKTATAHSNMIGAYVPPATFIGDGASNGGSGTWTTVGAGPTKCLSCHNGGAASDMTSYLMTGHKNMLRKVTPGKPWATSDGTLESVYFTVDEPPPAGDSLYASGSLFDWLNATITLGSGPSTVGTSPFAPGTTHPIVYQFGGWFDPTALDVVFRGGFTGEQWPAGNYDCGRCHTTGYRWDDTGPEPSDYLGAKISASDFSRIPTNFACSDGVSPNYAACVANHGTAATASWAQDGVTCERCHNATGHTTTGNPALVTKPVAEAATGLCIQCHREENVDTTANTFAFGACSDGSSPDFATCTGGGAVWVTDLIVYDGGSCSDGVSANYTDCTAAKATWTYAPFFDHESGPTFLNSPHARFDGSIALNAQNVTDMTLVLTGSYNSAFTDTATGQNAGCTGCHDVHQSLVPAVGAKPFVKGCVDCHTAYSTRVTRHPGAAGSPADVAAGDENATCAVCHMSQSYHLFRISVDPGYSTFPSAAGIAAGGGQALPNTASDGKLTGAVWSDIDLACGQCHVGSGELFPSPSVPGITTSKADLAGLATCMHAQPVIHTTAGANGTISPAGTIFLASGASQTLTFTAAAGFQVGTITLDGRPVTLTGGGQTATYTLSGVTDCHTVAVAFTPVATITATAGPNGTISPSGTVSVFRGGSQTYTFTPAAGYQVQNVVVDGTVSLGAVASYTFTNVGTSHTIAAYFAPITYTITTTGGPNGTVYPATATVAQGSSQTVTFTPASGYHVGTLTVDGASQTPATSYTFSSVAGNHTVAVTFAANAAATITATSDANGTITPSGTVNLLAGQSQSFSFTPNANYRLGTVTVDGAVVWAAYGYTFSNIAAGAHTIAVTFVPNTFTVTASVAAQGGGAVSNNVDSTVVTSGSAATTVGRGGSITFTVTPNLGYRTTNVAINSVAQPIASTYTLNNVQSNMTISVIFAPITYTITTTSGPNGTVYPATATVAQGSSQTVTFTPASGYHMGTLTVDGASQAPATSYTFSNVAGNHTVAVTFAANAAATITATSDANGTITPSGTVNLLAGQSQFFSFTPNAGYKLGTVTADGAVVWAAYGYTFSNIAAGSHTISVTFVPSP